MAWDPGKVADRWKVRLIQGNNGGFGVLGGQRMLVTRNTVISKGSGIEVGGNSTVTHNTAIGNGESGILAGRRRLLTQFGSLRAPSVSACSRDSRLRVSPGGSEIASVSPGDLAR